MKRLFGWVAVFLLCCTYLPAQVVQEFCVGQANCIPDRMEVVFDSTGNSALTLADGQATFDVTVQTATVSAGVQGWSYGLAHDGDSFSIADSACVAAGLDYLCGTEAEAALVNPFFNVSTRVGPAQNSPSGFISAVVLSFIAPATLTTGQTNSLAKLTYNVDAVPDANSLIRLADDELSNNGPTVALNITVAGEAKLPETLVHGEVSPPGAAVEDCANGVDDDGDGDVDCDDADCADAANCEVVPVGDYGFSFGTDGDGQTVINMSNAAPALAFQLGVSVGEDTVSFSGALGTDANRLVELLITDSRGGSHDVNNGLTVGAAAAAPGEINGIVRGSAIAGFEGGDFLAFDLAPLVGGPGFFVGYVSDLDDDANQIPATADGASNQILTVSAEAPPPPVEDFFRGDADGNGRINVADAVLIIQVVVGNLNAVYNCPDALDANDDGSANIADAVPVLRWVFQRGAALPAPFLSCGADPTDDDLGCEESSATCAAG